MRKALLGAFCTLLLFTNLTCSRQERQVNQVPETINTTIVVEHRIEKEPESSLKETLNSKKESSTREVMIKEVIQVWELFFEDYNVSETDPRRQHFQEYAEYVADAVIMYQNNDVVINGEHSRLPEHRSTHILVAVIITKESSVDHTVVGEAPRFEVGLMQLWGVALAGYHPDVVKANPKLGVLLGVRFLTHMLSQCRPYRIEGDIEEWRNTDWLGPLTMYGAKPSKVWKDRKNKVCRTFPHASERLTLLELYETRINAENQEDLLLQ